MLHSFKKQNELLYIVIISAMIFLTMVVYLYIPIAKAASLTAASDTLSDSDISATASHTFAFTIGADLAIAEYAEITLPAPFGDVLVGNITCPANMTATAENTETIRCTADLLISAGALTVTLSNTSNPSSAGSQTIDITTYTSGDVEKETADVMVAIIDDISISANVTSSLSFEINPLASGTDINGTNTTADSATTTLSFGTLSAGAPAILGQQLKVSTNAVSGYTVTLEQDNDLTSDSGADIDTFADGTPGVPAAWSSPSGSLGSENTYGHTGISSEDSTLTGGDDFGNNLWQGFNGTNKIEVMYNGGPADGITADKGLTQVGYQVEITSLQEAGDYTNTLTYVCTATY